MQTVIWVHQKKSVFDFVVVVAVLEAHLILLFIFIQHHRIYLYSSSYIPYTAPRYITQQHLKM